ncbi:DUF6445 family protein [Halioglobus sp. HI00S01]|uniref:DUF6445 family protein n=1 Tax=Halioglobus sp. HI00S01 TaxID=1822214 RepID=UPI0035102C7B
MTLALNHSAEINLINIDDTTQCIVVDDSLQNPDEIAGIAAATDARFIYSERDYPGGVMPLRASDTEALQRFIRNRMSRLFLFCCGGTESEHSTLSRNTTTGKLHLDSAAMSYRSWPACQLRELRLHLQRCRLG